MHEHLRDLEQGWGKPPHADEGGMNEQEHRLSIVEHNLVLMRGLVTAIALVLAGDGQRKGIIDHLEVLDQIAAVARSVNLWVPRLARAIVFVGGVILTDLITRYFDRFVSFGAQTLRTLHMVVLP